MYQFTRLGLVFATMKTMKGVNFGGWLVLERFITPSIFKDTEVKDEYSLSLLGEKYRARIRKHHKNFITEADFKWLSQRVELIRIPVGYWIFGDEKPYVESTERLDVLEFLGSQRAVYFTDKYAEYSYENDLRSFLPGWAMEVRSIIRDELNLTAKGLNVVDVGVGNGLEVLPIFANEVHELEHSVTGIDLAEPLLMKARKRVPGLRTVETSAERMTGVPTSHFDLYVSLRTYMSRLFDTTRAVEQALRVLRPDGCIVLSIANGYLVSADDGTRQLMRGLKMDGKDAVDTEEPHHIAQRLRRKLWDFGFVDVRYQMHATDVYVWGRAPSVSLSH